MPNYISLSQTCDLLPQANRILVVGCSGGGKTTLSRRLCARFGFDYISIDRDVRWLPGWQQRNKAEQRALISQQVQGTRWVMDGISISSLDLRLPRTDLVLWVRVPRHVALLGIAKRVLRNYGKVRFGMPEGCAEQLPDREFLSYIWNFERKESPRLEQNFERLAPDTPVAMLRSHRDIEQILH